MLQALHNTENLCKHGTFHKANRYPTVFFYRCFKEGEKISAGDVLCEIQTDKVSSSFAQSNPHGFNRIFLCHKGRSFAMHCCAINTRCLPQYPWEPETSLPYIILQILYYLEVNISNQTLFLNTIRQKYRRRNLGP